MNIQIRKGEEKNLPALLELIKELADFERAGDAVTNNLERMLAEQTYFEFFVAEHDTKVVGVALYFFAYFTWVGKSLYLDDVYVRPAYRGKQIGSRLLEAVFAVAQKENCQRLRWQVLTWNTPAIEIYKKIGARMSDEWLNCDFNADEIARFLRRKS